MDRYTAGHRRGVVCAPHFAAAEAGRAVLAEGCNALEAMVAMAAMIAVVYPHMNHLGGDGFWVVHEPSGKVRALMAAGAAGARATLAHYREAGHDRVPTRGPLAALTVPGAVAGWMLALQVAKAQGGRLPVTDLLAAAIKQARDGDIVVALVAGSDATLKRFYREAGDMVRLQPANATIKPILVPAREVEIQGRLLAVLRKYR